MTAEQINVPIIGKQGYACNRVLFWEDPGESRNACPRGTALEDDTG